MSVLPPGTSGWVECGFTFDRVLVDPGNERVRLGSADVIELPLENGRPITDGRLEGELAGELAFVFPSVLGVGRCRPVRFAFVGDRSVGLAVPSFSTALDVSEI